MGESKFQSDLIKKIKKLFPGCIVLKNDAGYQQGVPDLLILFGPNWAMLEVKASRNAREQPNQAYFIEKMNEMSFAAFIYPENEEEVLDGLQRTFHSSR